MTFDVHKIREDFPILQRRVGEWPLVYLDSGNTSQKPVQVIEAMSSHLHRSNANVARALHMLGGETTAAFEGARAKIADFIGAAVPDEVVFTKNASESLNLIAHSLASGLKIGAGDEIVVSVMEHHSNLVPWQMVCQATGATLRWFELTDDGRLDLDKAQADALINERTKIVSIAWISNVLGTINPVTEIADWAHRVGAVMVVDGAQAVPHLPCQVQELGADFLAFTGHKMCGPSGIGVLWGDYAQLNALPPFLGGGEMIEVVTMESSTYAPAPHRFEAGTPPITQAIGLGAAVDYLTGIGMDEIAAHDFEITSYMLTRLGEIEGLHVMGPMDATLHGPAVAFTIDDVHPHDVMQILDSRGIAVRGGHHCAAPLHRAMCIQSSTRASSYLYTTVDEVDALADALIYTRDFFHGKFSRRR